MALNVQLGFHPHRLADTDESDTYPTACSRPPLRRNNSSDATISLPATTGLPDNYDQIDLSTTSHPLTPGPDCTARWLASAHDTAPAPTSPIDSHALIPKEEKQEKGTEEGIDKPSFQDTTSPLSSLAEVWKNRKTSISFDPHVKLDSGHHTALEQPLPKPAIYTRTKPRLILQDTSRNSAGSPILRAYSEADSSRFDTETGHRKDLQQPQLQLQSSPSQLPLPYSNRHTSAQERSQPEDQASSSLTSESTASSGVPEARTPVEDKMETCVISPISPFPPFYQPTSLEDTTAWPKPRRLTSNSRTKSYTNEGNFSRRQGSRQGSGASRRSTSSKTSPATAFLSRFAREEAVAEPDGEGQEVGEYILGKEVGFGGFSVVREAYTLEGDERVTRAVKIVRKRVAGKDDWENDQLQAEFEHEVGLWRSLGHRHILPLIDVAVSDYATFCFTKLNVGGTLFDLVRNNRRGISQQLARRYTYQLASAIRYLHEDMHVVHRDIKLENCLIDLSLENAAKDGGNLLLCDFGLAEFVTNEEDRNLPDPYEAAADRPKPRNIGPSDTSTSIAGSLQYASPELIMSPTGFLSAVADVWAYGVVVFALLVGALPFQHSFQPRVQMMILAGEWNEEALKTAAGSQGMEDQVLDIVHGCLNMNSDERWEIGQVLKSGWLEGCQEMLEEISEQWKL
ncbi:MAG: hypothetical protein L6R37_007295 [Teloschistes peruensis]|nr:MAG: hypothetical protein L6R37_007295 [Teloschistes peruensis]